MPEMNIDVAVSLLLQESQEIEGQLRRKIFNLQVQNIVANERIAELEKAAGEAAKLIEPKTQD